MFFHQKNLKSENNNPWFKPWSNILRHTQSIVCAPLDSQVFRVLGIYNFGSPVKKVFKFIFLVWGKLQNAHTIFLFIEDIVFWLNSWKCWMKMIFCMPLILMSFPIIMKGIGNGIMKISMILFSLSVFGMEKWSQVIHVTSKDWPGKKVTIYFPIFYLVKTSENILFFYLHFTWLCSSWNYQRILKKWPFWK